MHFARANLSARYCNFRCVFALTTCVVENQAKYVGHEACDNKAIPGWK